MNPTTLGMKTSSESIVQGQHSYLRFWLVTPVIKGWDRRVAFWLCLSLVLCLLMAIAPLRQAFSGDYVLQDDSRQHIFWMERFVDPELFPNDYIVDYMKAVAPAGYTAIYRLGAAIGVEPLNLAKLMPVGLGILSTILCFFVSMQLLRIPAAAFVSVALLNESLWASDSIISSTPRAFAMPILLLFLFSLLRRSIVGSLVSILMLSLFYPPLIPILLGVLALNLVWRDSKSITLSRDRRDHILFASAVIISAILLIPYIGRIGAFGPTVFGAEARSMPEFMPGGRIEVFKSDLITYWLTGRHTGMFNVSPLKPIGYSFALLLPFLWLNKDRFQLINSVSNGIVVLPKLFLTSVIMFFCSHALLFYLFLPSRFTAHSFRIVFALAGGISSAIILAWIFVNVDARWNQKTRRTALITNCLVVVLLFFLVLQPVPGTMSIKKYKTGRYPKLYEFLSHQPKFIVVASLSRTVDDLPVFSKRSILVGREIALPYHKRYYNEIRQRAIDLINAQYSSDIGKLVRFIKQYEVSYLLLERGSFLPEYLERDKWVLQFEPAAKEAIGRLRSGEVPVLKTLLNKEIVLEVDDLLLVDTQLLLSSAVPTPSDSSNQ